MENIESLEQALEAVKDLRGELANARAEQVSDAHRRAQFYADELLTCALTIARLEGGDGDGIELDVALEKVRSRAKEHGLLQHGPPRAIT